MKLKEIFDMVLVESGQFLLGTDIEMNDGNFKLFMQSCLNFYNKHNSHVLRFPVECVQVGKGSSYTFEEDAPDIIFSANAQTLGNPVTAWFYGVAQTDNEYFVDKKPQPFRYEKPTLYSSYLGTHEVKAGYHHKITFEEIDGLKEFKIDTIDFSTGEHSDFLEYITGRFMMVIGQSRAAFTMSDIPLINNGETMISDGKEMREKAEEKIKDGGDWTHIWG